MDEERRRVWDVALSFGLNESSLRAQSSGSTGKPKTIFLPHKLVESSALRTNRFFGIDASSRLHSCVSAKFIGGKMMVVRALLSSAIFTWEIPSNRPILPGNRISLLAVVPSMMWHIVERFHENSLPAIDNIIVGGASIPSRLREEIAHTSLNVWETYGMTETASHIALRRIEAIEKPFAPLPGISVDTDSRGCLKIYLDDEDEMTRPLVTNDLAEIDSHGNFRILGRADNVIITGGLKVAPEEVERKIEHLIPTEFIITGIKSDKWGEQLIIRLENLPESLSIASETTRFQDASTMEDEGLLLPIPQALKDEFLRILPPHQRPAAILIKAFRRTESGKIRR